MTPQSLRGSGGYLLRQRGQGQVSTGTRADFRLDNRPESAGTCSMKTFPLVIMLAFVLSPVAQAGKCNPSGICRACTTCSSCGHCGKGGGKCSVCGGRHRHLSDGKTMKTKGAVAYRLPRWLAKI